MKGVSEMLKKFIHKNDTRLFFYQKIRTKAHIPLKNEFALGAQIDINNMKCTWPTQEIWVT